MKLVTVEGPAEVLAGLRSVAGVEHGTSGIALGDGVWQVSCRASDAAIAELETAGCAVSVLLDDEGVAEHDREADRLAEQALREESEEDPSA